LAARRRKSETGNDKILGACSGYQASRPVTTLGYPKIFLFS
jgi:hypothetical protein